MASTVARRETVEVFLSDKRVVASEAESVIPKGYQTGYFRRGYIEIQT
jgi:hypothetical protein